MSWPVLLTASKTARKPPSEEAPLCRLAGFWPGGRPAEFRAGEWQVFVRPIPVSKPQCLGCHGAHIARWTGRREPPLKVGDPVGAAIYALAPAEPARARRIR